MRRSPLGGFSSNISPARGIAATAAGAALLLLAGCSPQATSSTGAVSTSGAADAEMPAAVTPPDASGATPVSVLPSTTGAPLVQSAATASAASVQGAFEQVARAAAPAVVTLTTLQRVPTPRPGQGFGPFGPGWGSGGSSGGGSDPLEQLLRQFQQQLQQQFPQGDGSNSSGARPQAFDAPDTFFDEFDPSNVAPAQFSRRGGSGNADIGGGGGDSSGGAATGPLVGAGLGSGFLIRPDGVILTNAHVVQGAERVTVKLSDGREFRNARVLGTDSRTDIAVVKIPATGLPTLPLGSSNNVKVGDWAIAVGNPFGLDRTMTVGVISAINREVPISENGPSSYLQTDATINPGNSGGPLLDINGRVVGINDAIYSQSGGSVGIGFAIPIDTARQIAESLVTTGRVRRAFLGVGVTDLDDQAAAFGLPANTKGVLIEQVEAGSPAAAAGLQPGDVVTALNGQTVSDSTDFQSRIGSAAIGSRATMTVLRAGKTVSASATLRELRETTATPTPAPAAAAATQPTQLGVQIAPMTADLAARLGLRGSATGALIGSVRAGSPAQVAGLRPGDVIERVGQTPVSTTAQVKSALDAILAKQPGDEKSVALYVNRRGQRQYVVVPF